MSANIQLMTESSEIPSESYFAIYIDFDKNQPNPQRIFQAIETMIKGLQKLDNVLCGIVNSDIRATMLLEDIQTGSLKVWLRNQLTKTDDKAIENLDWKKIAGKYLVQAKYAVIAWTNKENSKESLPELTNTLHTLAIETNICPLSAYPPLPLKDFTDAVYEMQQAKGFLTKNDKMNYIIKDGEQIEFRPDVYFNNDELTTLYTKSIIDSKMDGIFVVKKPDYLGNSKWELRHGNKTISAKIEDIEWLKKFQNREVDVRPGDSLKCCSIAQYHYGYDNELIHEEYIIESVTEVLENKFFIQKELLDN